MNMNKNPKALILANAILTDNFPQVKPLWEASQELRRLHELNQELLNALKDTTESLAYLQDRLAIKVNPPTLDKARIAIAKAESK